MIDIRVTIRCPEILQAAETITAALGGSRAAVEAPQPAVVQTPTPAPTAQPMPAVTHQVTTGDPLPENVVQITTTTPPTAELPPELTQAHAPIAPVAPAAAPTVTAAQVARAGAMLYQTNEAARPQLAALLQQYGVKAAMDVPQDKLAGFADALRALGAKL